MRWALVACAFSTAAAYLTPSRRRAASPIARPAREAAGDDDSAPELPDDVSEARARLIARTMGGGSLTEGSDTKAVQEGWAYETPLLEAGCVLLGGTEQDFGFGLRQQYFHKCVLLLTQHDDQFTRGVIVNRPSRREINGWTVWCGGDVEEGGVFAPLGRKESKGRPPALECLSTRDVEGARRVSKGLWTSTFESANKVVKAGAAEKTDFMCLCGYAGWAPKQLDGEVERSSWHVAAADGGSLVAELLAKEEDADAPLDDGLKTWASLMARIGKDAAPDGFDFDDGMLRAWIDARLDAPRMDVSALADAARRQTRQEAFMKTITGNNGAIKPGAVLACQHVTGSDFLLEKQYLHKALIQVIAVQQELVIACVLNRPTSRKISLRLSPESEKSKTVAFGGDVQVKSAAGGVVWLSRGPLGDKGERLPLGSVKGSSEGDADATHVISAKDVVVELQKASAFQADRVLAASGVVAFHVDELARMLGVGHLLPVPLDDAPLEECWALHSDDVSTPGMTPDGCWHAAFLAGVGAHASCAPPATPAELNGGLADEALTRFIKTFLA
mmetsp:Transcript_28637/g.88559  ORF Transcript_28637/g.88559 Transcript_28637/m.88559 type:complete len:560 (+) Transcript_28637:156-1835(+)